MCVCVCVFVFIYQRTRINAIVLIRVYVYMCMEIFWNDYYCTPAAIPSTAVRSVRCLYL